MTTLAEARTALADVLAQLPTDHGGPFTVHTHVPDAVTGPCAVIEPAEEWLTPSDTFDVDEFDLTYDVWLVLELRSHAHTAEALDQLTPDALGLLTTYGWAIDRVARPGPIHTADWFAYGQQLTVSTTLTLT